MSELSNYHKMCYPSIPWDVKRCAKIKENKEAEEAFIKSRLEMERKMWYSKPEDWKTDEET